MVVSVRHEASPLLTKPPGEELEEEELEPVGVTRARFLQLGVYAAAIFMSVLNYSVLTPIYMYGLDRFDVGLQALNSLANVRTFATIPGVVYALYVTERHGFRASCLAGYAAQCVCALVAAAAVRAPIPPHAAFALLLASQAVSACGVALFQNNITRLSGEWFPAKERDAAVTAASLAGVAGTTTISLLAPAVAARTMSVDGLFTFQVPVWLLILGLAWFYVADEPPLPPSAAAAVQRRARRRAALDGTRASPSLMPLLGSLRSLVSHSNYMVLLFSSSFVIQMVYTLVIIMGPMLQPCGISPAATGVALAGFSICSALSPLLYLYSIMRDGSGTSPAYAAHQRFWTVAAAVGLAGVVLVHNRAETAALAVCAWCALGLLSGVLGNSGLTLEHAAEMTFPLPPNASITLLTIGGNAISCVQVVVATWLVSQPSAASCTMLTSPLTWFVAANGAAGLLLLAALRPEYRRAATETGGKGAAPADYGAI